MSSTRPSRNIDEAQAHPSADRGRDVAVDELELGIVDEPLVAHRLQTLWSAGLVNGALEIGAQLLHPGSEILEGLAHG